MVWQIFFVHYFAFFSDRGLFSTLCIFLSLVVDLHIFSVFDRCLCFWILNRLYYSAINVSCDIYAFDWTCIHSYWENFDALNPLEELTYRCEKLVLIWHFIMIEHWVQRFRGSKKTLWECWSRDEISCIFWTWFSKRRLYSECFAW